MKKETFEEICIKLKLEKNKSVMLNEVDSIILTNGVGIYPNWRHLRFCITDDGILVKHGGSTPYGARLSSRFNISHDGMSISFPPGNVVIPTEIYGDFRNPVVGDIIRSTTDGGKLLSESFIENVIYAANALYIKVSTPVTMRNDSRLSFYNPKQFSFENSIHSTILDGVYMNFEENSNGKKHKTFGTYQEIIKIKDISEINLKLNIKNKTFKLQ